ncbi:MAG: hypothetical protein D6828_00750 [Nitrospirae bacterium]|nr:MAG: hypothetical protein D6828_00750 [Nitrospirota bacterium]
MRKPSYIVIIFSFLVIISGCASVPYEFGYEIEGEDTLKLGPFEKQFERGKPNAFFDGLGNYVISVPSKLILWNLKVDNHNISYETEEKLRQYLADNDLNNVKVRLNQYDPEEEFDRLLDNQAIGWGWKYTVGLLSVIQYTIFPGRIFGGDNYNPFTNTINIYSDHKSIAIHEVGHAKDFAKKKYKGTNATLRILPLVPLWQEAVATGDAIGYDRVNCLIEDEKEDYKILYPAYGTYIAGEGLRWIALPIWLSYAVMAVAVIPGHIIGRIKANNVRADKCQDRGLNLDYYKSNETFEIRKRMLWRD